MSIESIQSILSTKSKALLYFGLKIELRFKVNFVQRIQKQTNWKQINYNQTKLMILFSLRGPKFIRLILWVNLLYVCLCDQQPRAKSNGWQNQLSFILCVCVWVFTQSPVGLHLLPQSKIKSSILDPLPWSCVIAFVVITTFVWAF